MTVNRYLETSLSTAILDATTSKDKILDILSNGERLMENYEGIEHNHPFILGLQYKKLIITEINEEEQDSIDNFQQLINQYINNKCVKGYLNRTHQMDNDELKIEEYRFEQIKDPLYTLLRIQMPFYEIIEDYAK